MATPTPTEQGLELQLAATVEEEASPQERSVFSKKYSLLEGTDYDGSASRIFSSGKRASVGGEGSSSKLSSSAISSRGSISSSKRSLECSVCGEEFLAASNVSGSCPTNEDNPDRKHTMKSTKTVAMAEVELKQLELEQSNAHKHAFEKKEAPNFSDLPWFCPIEYHYFGGEMHGVVIDASDVPAHVNSCYTLTFIQRLFCTLEIPGSSKCSQLYAWGIQAIIILSIVTGIMSTTAWAKYYPSTCDTPACNNDPDICPGLVLCEPKPFLFFDVIDFVCLGFFTADYCSRILLVSFVPARLAGTVTHEEDVITDNHTKAENAERLAAAAKRGSQKPPKLLVSDPSPNWPWYVKLRKYMLTLHNIIDLSAVTPFFVEIGLGAGNGSSSTFVRVARSFRLMRIAKLSAGSSGTLYILKRTMEASLETIFFLTIVLVIMAIIFGFIIYLIEGGNYTVNDQFPNGAYVRNTYDSVGRLVQVESPFTDVGTAMYWAIITVTTVGYGDIFPLTTPGRVIGNVLAIVGVMVIALPTGTVNFNFNKEYEIYLAEKELTRQRKKQAAAEEMERQRKIDKMYEKYGKKNRRSSMVGNMAHGFNKALSTTTKGISTLGNVMVAGVTGGLIGNDNSSEMDGELSKADLEKLTAEEREQYRKTRQAYASLNNFVHIWKAKRRAKQLRREKVLRSRAERGESTDIVDVEEELARIDEEAALQREEEIKREKEILAMHAIGINRGGRAGSPFAPPFPTMSPSASFYFTNAPLTNVPRSLKFLEKFQKEERKEVKEGAVVAVEGGVKLAKWEEGLELDRGLAEMSKEQLIASVKNIKSSFDRLLQMHMGAMEQAGAIYEEIDKIRATATPTSAVTKLGAPSTPK